MWAQGAARAIWYGARFAGRVSGQQVQRYQNVLGQIRNRPPLRPQWEYQAINESRHAARVPSYSAPSGSSWWDRASQALDDNWMKTVGGLYVTGNAVAMKDYARKQGVGSTTSGIKSTYSSGNFGKKVDNDRQAIYDRWKRAEEFRKRAREEEKPPDEVTDGFVPTETAGARGGGSRGNIISRIRYEYT